jgi:hypothetical protein
VNPRFVLGSLLLLCARPSKAQTITISGAQSSGLAITTATAGSQPAPVTSVDGSTTYTCQTPKNPNPGVWRITAALTVAMPAGTELRVKLAAPAIGGTSASFVLLSTTPVDVVTNIPRNDRCAATNIQYQFTATAAAGIIAAPGNTRTVTFTIRNP